MSNQAIYSDPQPVDGGVYEADALYGSASTRA